MNAAGKAIVAPTIPRLRRAARGGATDSETSFASLRAQGLKLVQALSGKVWTDYNLHDPGVTILEQLCYALTDLIYRADFPVADHLHPAGKSGTDYAALSLHPPHEAFPCRATSAADYRRVLLDEVGGLDDAELDAELDAARPGAGGPGLYRLQLKPAQGEVAGTDQRISQARAAYRARRNLCEDIDCRVTLVEDVWCNLELDLELEGPRDAASVLAEAYEVCARHIVQACSFRSLDELLARGRTLEQIYTGPATQRGFIDDDGPLRDQLFVSDLGNKVRALEGVQQLRRLALARDNLPAQLARLALDAEAAATNVLRWRGPGWALRLRVPGLSVGVREPGPIRDHLAHNVRLRRRGNLVTVTPADLASLMADLGAGSLARRNGHLPPDRAAMPQGSYRDLQRYYSVQNDFPAVYGLGARGMPASATAQEKAQALQLQTYLVLFEQVLAHSAAQIHHLRDLFSARGALGPSYWWQMLGSATVPGLDAIYRLPGDDAAAGGGATPPAAATAVRQAVQARVYEALDPRADRRSRVLDHLLALHGVVYTQNSMRQFCGYLAASELEAALLKNKAGFLRHVVSLARDRAAALDYSRPSWNRADNTSGLQRRVSWLLGFRLPHSRTLTLPLRRHRLDLMDARSHRLQPGPALALHGDPGPTAPVPLHLARVPRARAALRATLAKLGVLRGHTLSEPLLRCGIQRERYRWTGVPDDPDAAAGRSSGPMCLLLGPDEDAAWWPLGEYPDADAATQAAESLRRFLLHLSLASEGLHVVEHVLLRPVGASPDHALLRDLPPGFYAHRLTAVFPAWTLRCHDENFQRFAAQTVEINCPAHVASRCLWLGYVEMLEFEACYEEWLKARIRFCQTAGEALDEASADPQAVAQLNLAASGLIGCLRAAWPTAQP